MSEDNLVEILYVEPGKKPRREFVVNDIGNIGALVGGSVERYSPFEDDVVIAFNKEGKDKELPFNRALYDYTGEVMDVIAGNFCICYAPNDSEKLHNMPKNLIEKYNKIFKYPEKFQKLKDGIKVTAVKKSKDRER